VGARPDADRRRGPGRQHRAAGAARHAGAAEPAPRLEAFREDAPFPLDDATVRGAERGDFVLRRPRRR
jgi:hypothetical protein